jgi:crossover junction endodeoxyribonuclease RuvC
MTTVNGRGLIMGLDPGFGGAIAILDPINMKLVKMMDMPLYNREIQREINLQELASFVDSWSKDIHMAFLENVHAMPSQGVVSMFRFGECKGILEGILAGFYIPTIKVNPAVWKMSLSLSREKIEARRLATKLFPDAKGLFVKHLDDGRAESLLIAYFGWKHLLQGKYA